jgi:hypothetical protein
MAVAPQTKRGVVTAVVVLLVGALGFVVYAILRPAAPVQKLHVVITGNLGASVLVDDVSHRLTAYTGSDSGDFEVRENISVSVTSTGEAPRCMVTDQAGKVLVDKTGPTPQVVEQLAGWGADVNTINAPTHEMAICTFSLG